MRHILIDGTPVSRQMDGLTQYILNVVLRLDMSFRYTLLLRPNQCPERYLQKLKETSISIEEVDISPIGPLREFQFARYMRSHAHFDAAFIPSNQYPLCLRIPTLYVLHDLIYEQFPEQLGCLSILKRWYLHRIVRRGLCRASQVVAVSNYTYQEILKYHGEQFAEKITVVHEGWEHLLDNISVEEELSTKIDFKHYLLYVGSSRGHKNLSRLLSAMQKVCCTLPKDTGLVIVGNEKMFTKKQLEKIQEINVLRKTVQLTGWLTDEKLAYCFRNAKGLIFPSLCEGFGIPVLEAYYYHLPLLLSNQSSLPEVAGDAAIYFSPTDVEDMANVISAFFENNDYSELIEKQDQRLKLYSWKKTAIKITQILQSIWDIK